MNDQSHNHMKFVKGKDTSIEIVLRKALWSNGIRYRKNYKALIGKPDIVITKYKIAIFCDGDFWHGRDMKLLRIHSNKIFWFNKILRNKQRDEKIDKVLIGQGWIVIRFWETDIKKNVLECVKHIQEIIWSIQMDN